MSKPLQLRNLNLLILTVLVILSFSLGCSGTPEKSTSDSPSLGEADGQIFVGDSLEMNYDPNVIMKRAESFYEKESYPEAIVEYQHFLDLHHTHILAPYAQYKLALSNFKMIQTVDRDIEPIHKALEEFQKLSEMYPGNRYETEAEEKIQECNNLLAQHNLLVGKFYYRKESYLAAAKRFTTVAETYPHLDAAAEAKYRLAQTYKQLGAPEWSRDWLEALLRENPNHSFRKEGLELLAELQKENPTLVVVQNLDSFQQAFQRNGNSSVNGFATPSPSVPVSLTSGSKSPVNGFSVNQPIQVYNQVTDCPLGVWCDTASIPGALPFPRNPIPNTGICRPGEWC